MSARFGRRIMAALSIIALAMTGCAGSQPTSAPTAVSATATAAAGTGTVKVTLQEWAVLPAAMSAAAGPVTFQVTNTGPGDVHEFVVLKTDLDPGALPTDADGVVTQTGAGIEIVEKIEGIPIGTTQDLNVTLAAGKYVLLCNIYGERAHYQMGMWSAFAVP
jgi:uncharacterized cupredoxin-like copper-binding protein